MGKRHSGAPAALIFISSEAPHLPHFESPLAARDHGAALDALRHIGSAHLSRANQMTN
jgi:hypothetical protein